MSKKNKLTYDNALEELQTIVSQLQDEAISMDELSEKVQKAAFLIQFCKEKLRKTELEIQEIFDDKNKAGH
jgi:exodeoxyribonuclease VII small subunit